MLFSFWVTETVRLQRSFILFFSGKPRIFLTARTFLVKLYRRKRILYIKNVCKSPFQKSMQATTLYHFSFFLSADAFEFSHQADFELYFASLPMEHNQKRGEIA